MKRRLAQFLRRTANSIDPPPPNPMFSPWMLGATFAEIDAKKFERARKNPTVKRFARAADERLRKLKDSGKVPTAVLRFDHTASR